MNNRKISIIAMAAIMGVASVGTIAVGFAGGSLTNLVNAAAVERTVKFERAGADFYHSTTYKSYTTSGKTEVGTTMYLAHYGFSPSSGCVSYFSGGSSTTERESYFTINELREGPGMFRFQSLKSISLELRDSGSFSFPVLGSTNGTDWNDIGTIAVSDYVGTLEITAETNYIKVANPFVAGESIDIESVSVSYSCDPSLAPVESSVSSSQSTQSSQAVASLAGTYRYSRTSFGTTYTYDFIFNDAGESQYVYTAGSKVNAAVINWSQSGNSITLSIKEFLNGATIDNFSSYRPVQTESQSNTGTVTDGVLSINTYNMSGVATLRSFARQ